MPRPSKLTPEAIETITAALSNGLTRETSSRYAGITYQSFISWYNRGKAERDRLARGGRKKKTEAPYLSFFYQVEDAEAGAIVIWQQTVNLAARTDPTWAMKMLQLRDPRGYKSTEVTFNYDLSQATDEQLARIAAGEDPFTVMADTGAGDPASTPAPGGENGHPEA